MGFLGFLVFSLLLSCSGGVQTDRTGTETITPEQIEPGITLQQLKTIYPSAAIDSLGQFHIKESFAGLNGTWNYSFTEDVLSWATYDAVYTTIDEDTFYMCKNAAYKIIEDFTPLFGPPDSIEKGIQVFRDPVKTPHWGYQVVTAVWEKKRGYSRNVQFVFQGGKGEKFNFRISVELRG